jgi:hypothetical protein
VSASQPFSAMNAATASHCVASSLHQHQKLTHTERGNSWGLCAPIPAVVDDNTQACELGRGVDPRSFSRISHWLPSSSRAADRRMASTSLRVIRRNSPVRAVTGCAGAFIQTIGSGSRPAVGNTLADQQSVNAFADLPHVLALSSSAAFAGSQTSEALNGRVPNSSGAFQKSEGELPNVCC